MSSYFYDLIRCEIFMMSSLFTLHKVTSVSNIPGPWEGLCYKQPLGSTHKPPKFKEGRIFTHKLANLDDKDAINGWDIDSHLKNLGDRTCSNHETQA